MRKDNTPDLTEYGKLDAVQDDVEKLSEAQMRLIMDYVDSETPDLWDRIEAGFESEISKNHLEENNDFVQGENLKIPQKTDKGRNGIRPAKVYRRYFAAVAAAVLVVCIVAPIVANHRRTKSSYDKSDLNGVSTMEQSEEMAEDVESYDKDGCDSAVSEYNCATEDIADANNCTDITMDNATGSLTESSNQTYDEEKKEDAYIDDNSPNDIEPDIGCEETGYTLYEYLNGAVQSDITNIILYTDTGAEKYLGDDEITKFCDIIDCTIENEYYDAEYEYTDCYDFLIEMSDDVFFDCILTDTSIISGMDMLIMDIDRIEAIAQLFNNVLSGANYDTK